MNLFARARAAQRPLEDLRFGVHLFELARRTSFLYSFGQTESPAREYSFWNSIHNFWYIKSQLGTLWEESCESSVHVRSGRLELRL